MKIVIDTALCKARGRCYNLYNTLFAEGPGAKGIVTRTGEIEDEDDIVDAQSAANACPQGAISIED